MLKNDPRHPNAKYFHKVSNSSLDDWSDESDNSEEE